MYNCQEKNDVLETYVVSCEFDDGTLVQEEFNLLSDAFYFCCSLESLCDMSKVKRYFICAM